MRKLLFLFGLLATAAIWLTGCSSYAPLTGSEGTVEIGILPILNESERPQIIAPLSRNLREGLAHSPNWQLVGEDSAEVMLQITVLGAERNPMARDPQDTGRPLSYYEVVRVSVEWISALPTPWNGERVIILETDQLLYAQPSLINAESTTTGEIAARLAEKILKQLDWAQ